MGAWGGVGHGAWGMGHGRMGGRGRGGQAAAGVGMGAWAAWVGMGRPGSAWAHGQHGAVVPGGVGGRARWCGRSCLVAWAVVPETQVTRHDKKISCIMTAQKKRVRELVPDAPMWVAYASKL